MYKKKINTNRGITLIALVITVIVLLILAGTAISIAVNGNNIFAKANTAVESYNAKANEQQAAIETLNTQFNEYYTEYNPNQTPAETLISKDTEANSGNGFVGYYADMDNDGTVDGIIYADMLVGNTKNKETHEWNEDNWSVYNITQIPDANDVKDYCISTKTYAGQTEAGKYSANAVFGLKDVIVPATSSTGTLDRFYIMQLSDFANNSKDSFYWYYNASSGTLDRATSTGADDFGSGKQNTLNMLDDWNHNTETYGAQTTTGNFVDLWGAIQTAPDNWGTGRAYNLVTTASDSGKWFVPSKGEWSAFGGELEITASDYGDKGLSYYYWTSSQCTASQVYVANFDDGYISGRDVSSDGYVRLSATF